jgi:hypothetical protein
MRLFEVESRFENDFIEILRQLRGQRNSEVDSLVPSTPIQPFSWEAINGLLKNQGYPEVHTAIVAKLVKQSPALNAEIKTFDDETGITLNTDEEKSMAKTQVNVPSGPSVDQMARSASKDYQRQIG